MVFPTQSKIGEPLTQERVGPHRVIKLSEDLELQPREFLLCSSLTVKNGDTVKLLNAER